MNGAARLPELVDRKTLEAEMGVTRATIDAIFRALDVVAFPDLRKSFVRREDVHRLIEEHTFGDDRVRPTGRGA